MKRSESLESSPTHGQQHRSELAQAPPPLTCGSESEELTTPINLQAEQAIIGGICLFPGRALALLQEAGSTGLRPEHFVHGAMAQMFAALLSMAEHGIPISPIALAEQLAGRWPEELSVNSWLSDCTGGALSEATHIRYLSELVIRKAQLRALAKLGEGITRASCAACAEPARIARRAIEQMRAIVEAK